MSLIELIGVSFQFIIPVTATDTTTTTTVITTKNTTATTTNTNHTVSNLLWAPKSVCGLLWSVLDFRLIPQ
jgi:hypothetical protein